MKSSIQLTVIYTLCHIFFLLVQIVFGDEDEQQSVITNNSSMKSDVGTTRTSSTANGDYEGFGDLIANNKDMLRRAMYVTFAVTGILVVYFGIRFIRARRRKVRRYGRLKNSGENVEMAPLASDSEDDTLFDSRKSLMQ